MSTMSTYTKTGKIIRQPWAITVPLAISAAGQSIIELFLPSDQALRLYNIEPRGTKCINTTNNQDSAKAVCLKTR